MYKTIYNNPRERSQTTYSWAYWDGAFTDEELDLITNHCVSKGTESSTIIGSNKQEEVERVRVSQTHFHHRDNDTAWIFDRFNDKAIKVLNEIIEATDCEIVISSDWRFHSFHHDRFSM